MIDEIGKWETLRAGLDLSLHMETGANRASKWIYKLAIPASSSLFIRGVKAWPQVGLSASFCKVSLRHNLQMVKCTHFKYVFQRILYMHLSLLTPTTIRVETLPSPRRCLCCLNRTSAFPHVPHGTRLLSATVGWVCFLWNLINNWISISASFSTSHSANFSSETFKTLHLSWTCTHIFHCHYSLKDPIIYITCTSTIYITSTLYQGLWVIQKCWSTGGGCESALCKSRPLGRMLEHPPLLVSAVGRGWNQSALVVECQLHS